jgi:hypothetical protein
MIREWWTLEFSNLEGPLTSSLSECGQNSSMESLVPRSKSIQLDFNFLLIKFIHIKGDKWNEKKPNKLVSPIHSIPFISKNSNDPQNKLTSDIMSFNFLVLFLKLNSLV